MDNLEKYVAEHRHEFDTLEAPTHGWEAVSASLAQQKAKTYSLYRIAAVAASAVVVLGVGLLMGLQLGHQGSGTGDYGLQEFSHAESYYAGQFRVKWAEFETLGGPEANSVAQDLEQLDAVYNELKTELLQHPELNTQRVVDAMIENYRTKIDLLETVLDKTKKQNLSTIKLEDNELDEI